jgi:hypothetical protein
LLVLINATVYFLTGMFILGQQKEYASFEGLFTFVNAVLHFGVALLLKSRKPENKQLLVMLGGLVIVFITIAIPVQLEGNFVTVLWIAFASFMVFLGKKYSEPLFDRISVGLVVLAVLSLLQDWDKEYHHFNLDSPEKWLTPILNGQFLSSVLFLGCLGFIWKILKNQAPETKSQMNPILIQKAIPGLILGILFGACCMEISNFWYQLSENSRYVNTSDVNDYNHFGFDPAFNLQKRIWLLLFAFLYWGAISFANSKVTRDVQFAIGLMVIQLMIIFQFLFSGLMDLDELQNLYFQSLQDHATFTGYSPLFIVLRYVSFAFLGLSVWSIRKNLETYGITQMSFQWFELFAYFILLIITSNECIYWISRMDETASYKLGLSIFWGIYALVLISLGIGQKKKYLRIFAIVLFGITLLKLFFFDIAHLTTILKTVVLVSLGILLLVISFLYNKFQDRLNHE